CHSLSPLPRPAFPRVRLLPGQACCALCIMHSIKREAMGEILVGSLGGTIAMVEESEGGGALPRLGAEALLRSIPAFRHDDGVRAESLLQLPSASLGLRDVLFVLDWCRAAAKEKPDGIVLTQGTDTLEEVAFLLDLFWDSDMPLVVTG